MTRELRPADRAKADDIARKGLAMVEDRLRSPISLIPLEWRADAILFWQRFAAVFRDDISFHLMVSKWSESGVPIADAKAAFDAATTSEAAMSFKFATDITTFLETRIVNAKRRRQVAKENAERRSEAESYSLGVNIAKLRSTPEAEATYRRIIEAHNANMRDKGLKEVKPCGDYTHLKTVSDFFRDIGMKG